MMRCEDEDDVMIMWWYYNDGIDGGRGSSDSGEYGDVIGLDSSVLQLDILDRNQLASRLTLNCTDNYVEPQKLKEVYVTIMDVS